MELAKEKALQKVDEIQENKEVKKQEAAKEDDKT